MKRRPQLPADITPAAVWRLRLADGTERGPLTSAHVRELVECGAADAASLIADVGDAWQPLGTHALWPEMATRPPATPLRVAGRADPGPVRHDVHAATPRMEALWRGQRDAAQAAATASAVLEDHGRLLRALGLACAAAGLICVGDIIVFTCGLVTAFVFLLALVRLTALWLVWQAMR
jgi:hypothetical protein